MKSKILTSLKTKFKTLGLSEKAFDGVADIIAKTVKEESEIEAAVTGAEGMLKAVQGEADRVRQDSQKTIKDLEVERDGLKTKLEKEPETKPKGGEEGDEKKPEWAIKLEAKLQAQEEKDTQNTKLQNETGLKSAAKKIIGDKLSEKMCDEILANIKISEDSTAESISAEVIAKNDFFITEFTPQTGAPRRREGKADEAGNKSYFDSKKQEAEQAEKISENAEIK